MHRKIQFVCRRRWSQHTSSKPVNTRWESPFAISLAKRKLDQNHLDSFRAPFKFSRFIDSTVAQNSNPPDSAARHAEKSKKVTISGTVGTEGKTLLADRDNRIWNVANPESLKASEGRRVTVRAKLIRDTNQINVSTVRLNNERLTAKLDDAAFRR